MMVGADDLYEKYDLLMPAKLEGGYLIITLHEKIKSKEIGNHFTTRDIKHALNEISLKYGETIVQAERIIKNLLHYFLRNVPGEPGKYYLTDHAESMVELLIHKLDNPYKNFPLKKNFEKYFTIRSHDIKDVNDMERRFGREFVSGHKRIVNDHLESLEDELRASYEQLNLILQSDEVSATVLIMKFVIVFKQFGERAEDITNAIASKDKFLRTLRGHVDHFYETVAEFKHPETTAEQLKVAKMKNDYEIALEIYSDIDEFFQTVDYKIGNIRRQILRASEKLSELHENFSSRSHFRLQLKSLYKLALDSAAYDEKDTRFENEFPVKPLVYERTRLFFPEYYDFGIKNTNLIVDSEMDDEYLREERLLIEMEINRQEKINNWVNKGKALLDEHRDLELHQLIDEIMEQEKDFALAHHVAVELTQFVSEENDYALNILQQAELLRNTDTTIWKMNFRKVRTFAS